MKTKKHEIDMTQGSILKNIIAFAIPLMLTNVLQLLYNAIDVMVVGRFAGMHALAAVGATSSLFYFIVAIFNGFSLGPTVVISQKYGEGDSEGVHRAAHTSLAMGLIAGILAMIAGLIVSRPILELMNTPAGGVLEGATLYIRIICLGLPGQLVYNYSAAVMRGVGDTKRPFYILMTTGIVNLVLNLFFVIVLKMGVAGVALATIIANYLSAVIAVCFLINSNGDFKIYIKKLRMYKDEVLSFVKIGIPMGVQALLSNGVNIVVQSSVNSFGDVVVAGNAAATNIDTIIWMALNSFCSAAITCVGQNYGAKNQRRVKKAIYSPVVCVFVLAILLGAICLLFGRNILGLYIADSAEAIEFGLIRMKVILPLYFLSGIGQALDGVLRGFGYSNISLYNTLLGGNIPIILWIYFVFPFNRTFEMLLAVYPIGWLLVICLHVVSLMVLWKKIKRRMVEI